MRAAVRGAGHVGSNWIEEARLTGAREESGIAGVRT